MLGDMTDPERPGFHQTMQERVNDDLDRDCCSSRSRSTASTTPSSTPSSRRRRWRITGPWLRDVRAFRPHQLSDELERLLHEKSVAGRAAWTRLFDETDGRGCASASAARS